MRRQVYRDVVIRGAAGKQRRSSGGEENDDEKDRVSAPESELEVEPESTETPKDSIAQ